MCASYQPSAALLAANQLLFARREQVRTPSGCEPGNGGASMSSPGPTSELASLIRALPAHLGWGSTAVADTLRRKAKDRHCSAPDVRKQDDACSRGRISFKDESSAPDALSQLAESIRLYPDLALGMLRQEMANPGRLWLLLRYLDVPGRGVLRIVNIKTALTSRTSPNRLCGWRQLRNVLRQGDGLFWQRDKHHVWLRSLPKVAEALGVTRLTGRPVMLPVSVLRDSIGQVRAHFYASFHSGRGKSPRQRVGEVDRGMPISRASLEEVAGVGRRTQRAYEQRVGIDVQRNLAIGSAASTQDGQEAAWQHRQALFTLKDYRGYQGKGGQTYYAWQLPNSYAGPHARQSRGRQKHLNRQLAVLREKRDAGNHQVGGEAEGRQRRYYRQARAAVRALDAGHSDLYWSSGPGRLQRNSQHWYLVR